MRKLFVLLMAVLLIASAAWSKEYAIIKDTMFGSQKIEIFQSLKEALENFTGEGRLYEITLKQVPLRRVETKKKVEVSEYRWSVDEKTDKALKADKPERTEKPAKPAVQKN